jgi:hypothetical protein
MFAVVATITEVFQVKPATRLSTYCFVVRCVAVVGSAAVTFPATDSVASVPTDVSDEPVTPEASDVPVSVFAAAVTVMSADPSNATPLMFFVAASFVAVAAFPVIEPAIGFVTVRFASVPTDVSDEAVTVEFSVVPVSVPAAAATVMSVEPLNETPLIRRAV